MYLNCDFKNGLTPAARTEQLWAVSDIPRGERSDRMLYDQCPYCEKFIPSGLKACPECGRKFSLPHRMLDTYGATIPNLFAFVHRPIARLIPGKLGNALGNVLGFAAVLAHVSLMLIFLLVLVVAVNALLTGRLDDVDWFAEVAGLIMSLAHLTRIYPAIAERARRKREQD